MFDAERSVIILDMLTKSFLNSDPMITQHRKILYIYEEYFFFFDSWHLALIKKSIGFLLLVAHLGQWC